MRRLSASAPDLLRASNRSKPDSVLDALPVDQHQSLAPDVVPIGAAPADIAGWRPLMTATACGLGLTLFCLTLSRVDAGGHALPWYITMALLSLLCWRYAQSRYWQSNDAIHVTGFRNREPLNILEALAFSYLCAAAILYACACLSLMVPKKPPVLSRHIVDIEFSSLTDRVDNEEILPGEKEIEDLRKRTGDLVTVQGTLQPQPAKQPVSTRQEETRVVEKQADFRRPQESRTDVAPPAVPVTPVITTLQTPQGVQPPAKQQPLSMPATWATQVVKNLPQKTHHTPRDSNAPMFEEVQPPELVEMVDNDGTTESTKLNQTGGRSSGGTGAKSDLNTYLKELHKKIKTAWTPPKGQSRRAEILFRIGKPGKLVSIKLVKTSGDNETDEAAMQAVTAAVKAQGNLPPSYEALWLDIMYTFNYTAEELHELP